MLVKYDALTSILTKQQFKVFLIFGNDQYLMKEAQQQIKNFLKKSLSCDIQTHHLANASDWNAMQDEFSSFSLFSEHTLLQGYYEKKIFDKSALSVLDQLLASQNKTHTLLIHAPQLQVKSVQKILNHKSLLAIQSYALSEKQVLQWIQKKLSELQINYSHEVPSLIYQCSQGNMLATAQAVEKLELSTNKDKYVTLNDIKTHLIDQSQYSLFELTDALLAGKVEKSYALFHRLKNNKIEPVLILWLLSKELRLLLKIQNMIKAHSTFTDACSKVNIWRNKIHLYQCANQRLDTVKLSKFLQKANQIDQLIKSNQSTKLVWLSIEKIILAFSKDNAPL